MTVNANSYGTADEVAALTPQFATGGNFTTTTRPPVANVENWIDQVSSLLNTILAQEGFSIPVSQADAKRMLDLFVTQEVAAIVEGVNGRGRFGPSARGGSGSRFHMVMSDVRSFVAEFSVGLEELGVTRTTTQAENIAYRNLDESGEAVTPIFQRKGFGDHRIEWDD